MKGVFLALFDAFSCCYTDGWCCSLCIVVIVVHAYTHYASVVLSVSCIVILGSC